jgi:serine/threonine protein kinase
MSIPKVIGEGTYGCVHHPSLLCEGSDKRDIENVSKLMKNKAALTELKEYVVIDNIDKNKEFYLGKPEKCKLGSQKENKEAIQKCSIKNDVFYKKNYDNYSLLLMKNGGMNLVDYAKTTKVVDKDFLKELHRMFMGLMKFKEHSVIHHDLKGQNMVYNKEKKRCNFIDFGLMANKKTRIKESRKDKNGWAMHHWSFPFELEFLNVSTFVRELSKKTSVQIDNHINTIINDVKSGSYSTTLGQTIGYFLSSVHSEKISGASIDDVLQGYRDTCYQTSILASLHPMRYEDFLEKSLDTVDSYGLGISIMKVLKLITSGHTPLEKERELGALAFKMYHPSILQRIRIEEATLLYEKFLEKHVLKKNEHFVNHKIVKKTKIAEKIDNVLDKIELKDVKMNKKQMDQVSIEPIKECIKGKEYNPITKRCVKECKKGYERDNSTFKCVLKKKLAKHVPTKRLKCPKGKVRNPITKRCVLKCKPGYKRDDKFRCVSKKKRKRCPNGTRKNKETGKCEPKK